jgi:hypothetical protein
MGFKNFWQKFQIYPGVQANQTNEKLQSCKFGVFSSFFFCESLQLPWGQGKFEILLKTFL